MLSHRPTDSSPITSAGSVQAPSPPPRGEERSGAASPEQRGPFPHRGKIRKGASVGWRSLFWVSGLIGLVLSASACGNIRTGDAEVYGIARFKMPAFPKTGANRIQVYTEMHYQPSYRLQEGPRLQPPPGSVPVTGRELHYASLEEHKTLQAPDRVVRTYDATGVQRLYTINCMVCHGPTLKGDKETDPARRAKVLPFMTRPPLPEDLTGESTKDSTDGELFAFISNGGRQGYALRERGRESNSPMPEFRFLLTEDERWALVMYLRSVQGPR